MKYSRYELFGDVPFQKIEIDTRITDKKIKWKKGMLMSNLSNNSYKESTYGWLIMLANPKYSLEFDINEGDIIRIPFPLETVLKEVIDKINELK